MKAYLFYSAVFIEVSGFLYMEHMPTLKSRLTPSAIKYELHWMLLMDSKMSLFPDIIRIAYIMEWANNLPIGYHITVEMLTTIEYMADQHVKTLLNS